MEFVIITDKYCVSHMWQKQSWCDLNMQKAPKNCDNWDFPVTFWKCWDMTNCDLPLNMNHISEMNYKEISLEHV